MLFLSACHIIILYAKDKKRNSAGQGEPPKGARGAAGRLWAGQTAESAGALGVRQKAADKLLMCSGQIASDDDMQQTRPFDAPMTIAAVLRPNTIYEAEPAARRRPCESAGARAGGWLRFAPGDPASPNGYWRLSSFCHSEIGLEWRNGSMTGWAGSCGTGPEAHSGSACARLRLWRLAAFCACPKCDEML
jgi:hypothetical protein